MSLWSKIQPKFWQARVDLSGGQQEVSYYRRIWKVVVAGIATVAVLPLVGMAFVYMSQYQNALRAELIFPVSRLVSNTNWTIAHFLHERKAALRYIVEDKDFDSECSTERLNEIFRRLKTSYGGFIDLGVIDSDGIQRAYVGPYKLTGADYHEQPWFREVIIKEVYISDVFGGFRDIPHFVIAVKHDHHDGGFEILRATIDTDRFNALIGSLDLRPFTDAFLINREGVLQTPSRFHGKTLEKISFPVPPMTTSTQVHEIEDDQGQPLIMGYAYIQETPFIFMVLKQEKELMSGVAKLRRNLSLFLGLSVGLILLVILGVATHLVNLIYEADFKRTLAQHKIEHTNKMASIGRLAAGVAHEINNPLAIINEKSGLLKDLLLMSSNPPPREKLVGLVDSVTYSVERCKAITHRLLGFARHIDVRSESIDMGQFIKEVLGFIGKEAQYRNIKVNMDVAENIPLIESDRGRMQQIFLNVLNNAFAAVNDGGKIDVSVKLAGEDKISVTIADDGCGIPAENLKSVFEPFFSTKGEKGTGLGLSITYGLVQKLGGNISVESEVNKGTRFTITLPVRREYAPTGENMGK